MMDETVLVEKAWQLAARERRVRSLGAAASALGPGAGLSLVLVTLLRVLGQPGWDGLAPLALLPAGAALRQFLRPTSPVAAAYRADRRLGLQERLGTAVEWLLSERPRTLMAQVLVRDAAERARGVRPEQAFPLAWPASLRAGLLLALLVLALAAAPPHLFPRFGQEAEALAAARRQAAELDREVRELRSGHETPELRDLQARVEALERQFERPDLDPREAMERVTALAKELERRRGQGGGPGLAGESGSGRESEARGARALRDLARALARDPGSPDARGALRMLAGDPESSEAVRAAAREALEALEQGDAEGARDALAGEGQPGAEPGEAAEGRSGQGSPQARGNPGQPGRTAEGGEKRPADFGRGTTLERQEAPGEKARDFVFERQSERTGDWSEEYRRLHPPKRDDLATADARASGRLGTGRTLPAAGEGRGLPTPGGASTVEVRETLHHARESAEQAVAREEIPASRRDLVRDYFEGIDPRR